MAVVSIAGAGYNVAGVTLVPMRVRLAWAFAMVALVTMLLAVAGVNVGMSWSMGHMMAHFGGMGGMMGQWSSNSEIELLKWSAGAVVVGLIVAAAAGWWVAARIAEPLRGLARAVQRIGRGDLAQRVAVPERNDEVAELARAFNRMAADLQVEDQTRRAMLADVAHELRHPVAVLQGQLEVLQDGVRPLSLENLLPMQDEVIRLGRLIGDLRDLSLAEAGALALDWQPLSPAQLLDALAADLSPVAEAKGVTLAVHTDAALPQVTADSLRVRQVLVNLITNGIRFTPAGGSVTVTATGRDDWLEVVVADTGAGIPPADLPHVFDRFYRADRSRSRQQGGSGLGLAISRSLVALHGGSLDVESVLGQGSRFTVRLPLRRPAGVPAG